MLTSTMLSASLLLKLKSEKPFLEVIWESASRPIFIGNRASLMRCSAAQPVNTEQAKSNRQYNLFIILLFRISFAFPATIFIVEMPFCQSLRLSFFAHFFRRLKITCYLPETPPETTSAIASELSTSSGVTRSDGKINTEPAKLYDFGK